MDGLYSLIVMAVIYIAAQAFKKVFADRQVLDEAFPQVEVLEPEEPEEQPVAVNNVTATQVERRPMSPRRPTVAPASSTRENVEGHRVTADVDSANAAESRERRFTIKGKSEARRAFIYSEIFGRKYQ
ncbi:MAG: hypothetical protein IKY37_01190 [Bacteroidaceae bacterium]|nr:hypothetical protein [Bacteroidaceae bacterium]